MSSAERLPNPAAAAPQPTVRRVATLDFHAVTEAQTIDLIMEAIQDGAGGWVVTPNVDVAQQAAGDDGLHALVEDADLCLADGMPLVWASRLSRQYLPERVAGSDLAPKLARRASEDDVAMMLLGGPEGAAEEAARRLTADLPGLRIGWHCPPVGFEHDQRDIKAIEHVVEALNPCICLVGLGFPKQERLCQQLSQRFPASWFLSVGATIEFLAGRRPRAHPLLRLSGLEWLHRLLLEPRRLARRYLRDDLPFAVRLLASSYGEGRRRNRSSG